MGQSLNSPLTLSVAGGKNAAVTTAADPKPTGATRSRLRCRAQRGLGTRTNAPNDARFRRYGTDAPSTSLELVAWLPPRLKRQPNGPLRHRHARNARRLAHCGNRRPIFGRRIARVAADASFSALELPVTEPTGLFRLPRETQIMRNNLNPKEIHVYGIK